MTQADHLAAAGGAACPKDMRFGPCGGVRPDGTCEAGPFPCPFLDQPMAPGPVVTGPGSPSARGGPPIVLVDVRGPVPPVPTPIDLWTRTAEALQGCWALLGDHVDNPTWADDAGYVHPEGAVATLTAAGVPTIATVTGRSTTLEAAVARAGALRDAGAAAVHCVTGDHPAALGIARPVAFGAESTTIVAGAAAEGITTTVAESPASPGWRVARLLAKRRAGAGAAILNHAGAAAELIDFADRCAAHEVGLPLIAPVPMVADRRSARALAAFPGLRLPPGFLDAVVDADDPFDTGLGWAADLAGALLASGRFAGVNLSGSPGRNEPDHRLAATRAFAERVLGVLG